MFSCKAMCSPADPSKDTVRFDAAALAKDRQAAEATMSEEAQEAQRLEEEETQRQEQERLCAEAERAEQQRREEMEAQRRLEEEERRRQEEEQRRAEEQRACEEQARWELEEQARRAEEERRAREELARAEAERAAAEERERKAKVATYLKENKFTRGVTGQKKSFISTTYPLHDAAKSGNAQMVELLLKEGADSAQKNSSGKTAAQVAQKSNRENSHAGVLRLLAASGSQRAAGGA